MTLDMSLPFPFKRKFQFPNVIGSGILWVLAAIGQGVAEQPAAEKSGFLNNGVTAHRGSSLEFPENTLTAFREAIKLGVDWVETDIHRTKDGELVICHDADTHKVADRKLVIAGSTLAELQSLDMAYQFRKQQQLSEKECPVERIPTLSETLELI